MPFHRRQNSSFNGQQQKSPQRPQNSPLKPPTPPLPAKQYSAADIHVDVVDLSFNDIRKVETGKYPDGGAIIEYLTEQEAAARGFLEQWKLSQPIDEYKQNSND